MCLALSSLVCCAKKFSLNRCLYSTVSTVHQLLPSSSLPIDVSQISRWDNFLTVYYETRLHQCNVTYTQYESIKKCADHIFDLPITTYLYFAQVAELYVYQLDYIIELLFGRELYIFFNLDNFIPLVSLLYFLFMPNSYIFYCLLSNFKLDWKFFLWIIILQQAMSVQF